MKAGAPIRDGHVNREFTADETNETNETNEKWLVDINEHWTSEVKSCLCALKDVYSSRIVEFAIDTRMKSSLALRTLPGVRSRLIASVCELLNLDLPTSPVGIRGLDIV